MAEATKVLEAKEKEEQKRKKESEMETESIGSDSNQGRNMKKTQMNSSQEKKSKE